MIDIINTLFDFRGLDFGDAIVRLGILFGAAFIVFIFIVGFIGGISGCVSEDLPSVCLECGRIYNAECIDCGRLMCIDHDKWAQSSEGIVCLSCYINEQINKPESTEESKKWNQ